MLLPDRSTYECECDDPFIITTVDLAVGFEGLSGKVQGASKVVQDGATHIPLTSTLRGACVVCGTREKRWRYDMKASNWDVIKWMVRFNGIWRDHTGVLQQQKHPVLATKVKDQSRGKLLLLSKLQQHITLTQFLQKSRQRIHYLDRQENK